MIRVNHLVLIGGLLLFLPAVGSAQERLVLTVPLPAPAPVPAIGDYTPGELRITLVPAPAVVIVIIGTDGTPATFTYPCSTGCAYDTPAKVRTLIEILNSKVNMATRSLWRRVFDRVIADFPERFPGGATVP